jgi:hypothetical protein
MYLLNPNKRKSVAHLWLGEDTACKLYYTSHMKKDKLQQSNNPLNKKICTMCIVNNKKLKNPFVIHPQESIQSILF